MLNNHSSFFERKLPRVRPFLSFWWYRLYKTRNTAKPKPAPKMRRTTTMLNPFSWSLDNWFTALQVMSALILSITVAVGYVVNTRQADKIANLEVARAKLELETEKLRARQEPRAMAVSKLMFALEGKPSGVAEVLYQDGDGEAASFASLFESVLVYAKWKINDHAQPIGDRVSGSYSGIPIEELRKMSAPMRLGATVIGVSIIANRRTMDTMRDKEINPLKALLQALAASDIRVALGQDDSSLPDGFLRIVVAQKE
jgi:hypothetical protein